MPRSVVSQIMRCTELGGVQAAGAKILCSSWVSGPVTWSYCFPLLPLLLSLVRLPSGLGEAEGKGEEKENQELSTRRHCWLMLGAHIGFDVDDAIATSLRVSGRPNFALRLPGCIGCSCCPA